MLALVGACKPSGNEAFAEGLRLLGEAERGPCKIEFDSASGNHMISAASISQCLVKTREGLDKLHEAKQLGVDHREINDLISKTEAEIERLESMRKMVLRMQNSYE